MTKGQKRGFVSTGSPTISGIIKNGYIVSSALIGSIDTFLI